MKIKAQLNHEKVQHDQENDTHLVVSLQAPKLDWQNKRAPVCIINAIDISGSMQGEKLHFAKQSVMKLVDHLKPGDWCGLVGFESSVHPIFEPREMTQTQKESLKAKVGSLSARKCTNFSGGMLQALQWAKKLDLPENVQIRVIMFTDGLANEGVATDLNGLSRLLKAKRGRATLSAFGYGTDADSDLLASLAREGGGNYAFIRNPEEALSAFARELGGLLSTYATDIEVTVSPCNGHTITEVVSDVEAEEKGKEVCIKLPSIYSEEEINLVLGVKLSEQTKPLPRKLNVVEVKVDYKVLTDEGDLKKGTAKTKAKVRFVKPGEEQKDPTPEVDKIVSLAQLVRAQIVAEEKAKSGLYADAVQVMDAAASMFGLKGQTAYASAALKARGMVNCADSLEGNQEYMTSSRVLGTRGMSIPSSDGEAQQVYSTLGVKFANPAQDELEQSFKRTIAPNTGSDQFDLNQGSGSSDSISVNVSTDSTSVSVSKSRSSRW